MQHNASLPDINISSEELRVINSNEQSLINEKIVRSLPKVDCKGKFIRFAYIKPQVKLNPYLIKSNFSY